MDKRFALIDTEGHYRFPYKKQERSSGRYGFVIGRDRHGKGEYTESLERVIKAVVFEGMGARMKAEGVPGKAGNTVSLHAEREIESYWLSPELHHLVDGAKFRPINDLTSNSAATFSLPTAPSPSSNALVGGDGMSEDELTRKLERQSETGKAGEFWVVQDEIERLRMAGCPDPQSYVRRVAESDVGRGYDVESTWPGQERCIEVKTTTCPGSDFYLTLNERKVLGELGDKGWLYRVCLEQQGLQASVTRLQNPMRHILEDRMVPVVWRVKGRL